MTRTATTMASKTVTISKVKAKHIANQAGLDRLQELLVKATSNPNVGQNYAVTIKRAFRSLQECKEPILTQKDAVKLKYIGPAMAKKICPQSTGAEAMKSSTTNKSKAGAKSKAKTKSGAYDDENKYSGASVGTSVSSRPSTGLPLVCPFPTLPSTSRCTSTMESLSTAKEEAYAVAKAEAERLVLPPRGPWKVILLVDIREHKSKQVVSSCKQAGIPCEERQLAIGDMAWIARCVVPNETGSSLQATSTKKRKKEADKYRTIEILVGTIVERKEVSDLASSLFGTRYAEQRLRLSQCGLPQVLFLVEGNLASVSNCPAETLQMAMMETRINLGFQIVHTKHITDTVTILKTLHSRIVQRTFPDAFGKSSTAALPTFVGGNSRRGNRRASSLLELVFDTPPVPPFGSKRFITYPELKAKVEVDRERGTRSVRAISLAMLKQIPTLSQKKCTAIANNYPTLNQLLTALSYPNPEKSTGNNNTRKQHPNKIVQEIEIDSGRRTIGPKSASEIYTACCTLQDGSTVACHEESTKEAAARSGQRRMSSFYERVGSFDNNDNENRKPAPRTETNVSKPYSSRCEKPPAKKSRTNDVSTTTTLHNTTISQFYNLHSSPEATPRAFTTRKRPAPSATSFGSPHEKQKKQTVLDTQKETSFDIHSPLRRKKPQIQETVDLLTPESSAKPAFAKKFTSISNADWSDSSDDVCNALGNARKNNPLATNGIASGVASKQSLGLATKQKTPQKQDTLLLSSDEEDSPFPIAAARASALTNGNFSTIDNTNQFKSNSRTTLAKEAGNRLSLDSSLGDSSFLFSSPDENSRTNHTKAQVAASQQRSSAVNMLGETHNSDETNDGGVVCLLDDSDDESSGRCLTGKRDAFVTTSRGAALHSTQESAAGDDSNSSDEDLEFGTSLRERLGAIRGRDLKEVIELDSDSD